MAASMPDVFNVRTFCLITGASKGIGRGIATSLGDKVGDNSVMVLVARSEAGLLETKRLITCRRGGEVDVRILVCDLGVMMSISSHIQPMFTDIEPETFQHAILINNAGSLGDVSSKLREFGDPFELQNYYGLNVTTAICVTSQFLTNFPKRDKLRRTVVNITSLCAIQPFKYSSLYCSSRAARDMLFQVLAAEEPDVRVVSYSPGPIDTDMQRDLRENLGDPEMQKVYADLETNGALLTVDQTMKTLIALLEEDSFKSGSHVDYYDINK
ncbi:sepiapterin reductase-like [Saccoglossus kowalevskii]|uniref:Sepiapterin reductase n=1 Tax=Saccoglossus kowalevskii TaxID=10224 RepID=A0ABM0GIK7_SACKO|nr:PREDICTED: sepiapterin reductase-like [Saccoglossus kowalevskii]